GLVNLSVYDVLGRKTATLINDYKQAGSYSITWNGMDEAGNPAPTGIYFVSMQHAGGTVNQKMMLLK
nr:T9SS type A sorting domain-containing protein [FCB group bacterium]